MSMLTPPGMGGKYRITGNRYPRMRRPRHRRRIYVALFGAAVALSLVGWGSLQLIDIFTGSGGTAQAAGGKGCSAQRQPSASPSPEAEPEKLPEPGKITVNVYNATTRTGLAQDTADELEKRGFTIGKVANAPAKYDKKVEQPGLLLGAPKAADGAFDVLGTQLDGAKTVLDQRKGADIDLIIGDGFEKLEPRKAAERALTALAQPSPEPSASATC